MFAAAMLEEAPAAIFPSALELAPFAPLRPFAVVGLLSLGPLEASDLESSATVVVRCWRGGAMMTIRFDDTVSTRARENEGSKRYQDTIAIAG